VKTNWRKNSGNGRGDERKGRGGEGGWEVEYCRMEKGWQIRSGKGLAWEDGRGDILCHRGWGNEGKGRGKKKGRESGRKNREMKEKGRKIQGEEKGKSRTEKLIEKEKKKN
jgi:hypothetical protein